MRTRISIRGSVRPFGTRSFQGADYGRKWSEMTRKTVEMLRACQNVFQIVPKRLKKSRIVPICPKMSQNVQLGRIIVRMDLFFVFVCFPKQRMGKPARDTMIEILQTCFRRSEEYLFTRLVSFPPQIRLSKEP